MSNLSSTIENSLYNINLDAWTFHPQEKDNHCLVASIQETVHYLTGVKVNQKTIAFVGDWEKGGMDIEKGLITLNALLNKYGYASKFYLTKVPKNFAKNPKFANQDVILFEMFVTEALKKESPVIIGIRGKVPWSKEKLNHAFSIVGIEVLDGHSSGTIYTVSDTVSGGLITHFRGKDLKKMFTIDEGCLFSINNNYDLESRKVFSTKE